VWVGNKKPDRSTSKKGGNAKQVKRQYTAVSSYALVMAKKPITSSQDLSDSDSSTAGN